jgi:excisionase family DNA binding protein
MDQIPTSPYKIPKNAHQRDLATIDPTMYLPVAPALRPLIPILKSILRQTAPKKEPEKSVPIKCDLLQNPQALLNLFYPGSFPDPLRLANEQEPAPDPEPKPASDSPYMDFNEACAYLRLTQRQLRDLCRDQNITHARIDYRTYRFKKSDLDEWFEAYKMRRKSVYD